MTGLKRTSLHDLHVARGARMVPFAGCEMPVQHPMGVPGEHLHTREKAGLSDVSHMGQIVLRRIVRDPAKALETLVPADVACIPEGCQRYGIFTSPQGGVLDDLIADKGDHLVLVLNAGCVDQDLADLQMLEGAEISLLDSRALSHGPATEAVLARLAPEAAAVRVMNVAEFDRDGTRLWISRLGYTREDGFEISVPSHRAEHFAQALLAQPEVALIGLGAHDSLRLKAGMPLSGHDMNAQTPPAAAGLGWSIPKARRAFPTPGDSCSNRPKARRPRDAGCADGRAPIRKGMALCDAEAGSGRIGTISTGRRPVAAAILPAALPDGASVRAGQRGKRQPATIVSLPFVNPSCKR